MTHKKAVLIGGVIAAIASFSELAGIFFLVFVHASVRLARPWTVWEFALLYGAYPRVRQLVMLSVSFSGAIIGYIAYLILRSNEPSPHGDARWAREKDIRKAGLRAERGLLLGKKRNWFFGRERFLVSDGFEHVLCFAPTGAGKGVGIVIPNLLNWRDSAIVHDIKGENFRLTSGFRAACGQKVFFFNPGDPHGITHAYNPLEFVSDLPSLRVNDIQKIAHFILPAQQFWETEARSLFLGLVLYLIERGEGPTSLGEVLHTTKGSGDFTEFLKNVLLMQKGEFSRTCTDSLSSFVQKSEKERSGVLSTLNSALELWANPVIDAATATSDFDLRRLKAERTTIYVGVAPSDLQRLRPLMQIFYQQAIDFMTMREPKLDVEPYGVLYLMDEFTSLGNMAQFEKGIAYFRGYRVRLLTIVQDITQLESAYQKPGMQTFLGNSKIRVTYAANNIETALHISKLLGNYGATNDSRSDSRKMGLSLDPGSRSESVSKIARALLLPQEILQLPPAEEIVFVEAASPIRAQKIRYYTDPAFENRLIAPVPIPTAKPVERKTTALLSENEAPELTMTDEEIQQLMDEENNQRPPSAAQGDDQ